jgi:putative transposase
MTVPQSQRTYFVTFNIDGRRRYMQSDRNCQLFLETLKHYREQGQSLIHAFVIMPDHVHLILTPAIGTTLEKAIQLIKGGFSYRAKQAVGPIWQKSFNESQIQTVAQYHAQVLYIHLNPVRKGMVEKIEDYEWSSAKSPLDTDPPWFAAAKAVAANEGS